MVSSHIRCCSAVWFKSLLDINRASSRLANFLSRFSQCKSSFLSDSFNFASLLVVRSMLAPSKRSSIAFSNSLYALRIALGDRIAIPIGDFSRAPGSLPQIPNGSSQSRFQRFQWGFPQSLIRKPFPPICPQLGGCLLCCALDFIYALNMPMYIGIHWYNEHIILHYVSFRALSLINFADCAAARFSLNNLLDLYLLCRSVK
mmetsp:Transcript_197/g.309  ORF Transcript_197/g.309 Transcript_197/m.309 type:complete len:202 (-) Transcript_197:28-633(-)